MSSSRKGDRTERELVNMFDSEHFASIRVPASGGATTRELPDIEVGNGFVNYAIECKASKPTTIYIDWKEVMDLLVYSNKKRARARIGVRYDREEWRFYHPSQLPRTDSENIKVEFDTGIDHETFEDLISTDGL